MLQVSDNITISEKEIEITAIRAQGSGGQNVNKVSSAVHLRFNIMESSLSDYYKEKLLKFSDKRINKEGVIVIKSQQYRTREKNKVEALRRLCEIIQKAEIVQKKRKSTKPSKNAKKKRMDEKNKRGQIKLMRKKVDNND